jgi:hypothetical protein
MTTNSIPASAIVSVTPGVISAGGTGLDLCGLFLTSNTRVPIGDVALFTSADAVATYFGASSTEANLATTYFAGSDNSPIKPGHILFTQYPTAAVPAYLRGGDVSAMSLATLKAITGTIIVTVNGVEVTSATLDLTSAVSFSTAAALITTALAHNDAVFTAAIAGTTMTVSAVASGTLAVGQVVAASGVTAGTVITALGTGTGGTGTYTVSPTQTVASRSMTAGALVATYDSTAGAFVLTGGTPGATGTISIGSGTAATALKLTAETAAETSQGAAAGVPDTAMDAVIANTQNFATFATTFEPSTDDCVAFAEWTNSRNSRFAYVLWDTDAAPTTTNDTTSAGYRIRAAEYGSTVLVYAPVNGATLAAFVMGAVASIDFTRVNGRTNLAFRSAAGITADVTSEIVASNLIANGYNFYGAYATAADGFVIFYPGSVTGDFLWLDTLINEIWMTNAFQLSLMTMLTAFPSIPYNTQGYGMIEQSLLDPIYAAVNFGAVRAGVTLSQQQKSQINSAAGNADAAATVETVGWYLQVQPASPQVRAARGSPPITFWYTDGQSIQKIALNSLEVQ